MAKYSYDFKKQVVDAYLRGEGGYTFLAEKYGVKNRRQVLNWVHYYEQLGDEGLMRARKNDIYSFDFKLSMVESYLSSEFSYQELALENGINNAALISKWVNEFRVDGPDALRSHKKGRKKTLNKSKTDNKSQVQEERAGDTSAEHVKELEDELLKLRIENAFLKELSRLLLEDEAKMRERHSSSVASEENSN
jgi:transposase